MAGKRKRALCAKFFEYCANSARTLKNYFFYDFSMAAVESCNPVMPEPEWAKPRDKNAPHPV